MKKVDFNKTPEQVWRDIEGGLEDLTKYMAASKGHKEKGTGALFHVVTILIVLLGNSAFAFLFDPKLAQPKAVVAASGTLSMRDSAAVVDLISRIESGIDGIEQVRSRVAPSMPIDGQIANLRGSAASLRSLLVPREQSASGK